MTLVELIAKYIVAKNELDKAKSDCASSWGYYLHDQIEKVDDLSKQIDEKVIELVAKAKE